MRALISDATYCDPKNGAMPLAEAFVRGLVTFQKNDYVKKLLSDANELLNQVSDTGFGEGISKVLDTEVEAWIGRYKRSFE